jgi:uncharacterized protein (TIGR02145 family)
MKKNVGSDPTGFHYDTTFTGWEGVDEGNNLRATGTTYWTAGSVTATNSSGFTALGTGRVVSNAFSLAGTETFIWTSTAQQGCIGCAWEMAIANSQGNVSQNYHGSNYSLVARCIKN